MSEGGPYTAEMGITQKDLGVETKQEASKIVLPTPPEGKITIVEELSPTVKKGLFVESNKEIPYKFEREQKLPPQEQFSDNVKNMILAPIRGELDNGNLANFLQQLNAQKGFDSQDKLGLVLLINDNAKDRDEGKDVVGENSTVSQYVSLLAAKDSEGIGQLDIPQEYKELAQEIIDKDKLEIRQDYLHADQRSPHFGLLRSHLFKEAKAFKNSSLPDSEVIMHLSDMDVTYPPDHFQSLKNFYADPSHQGNLAEQDFLPGTQEGAKEEDISRDLLYYLDEFRADRYSEEISSFISRRHKIQTGSPAISGRLSYFEAKNISEIISQKEFNEDWTIGEQMRIGADGTSQFGSVVGNVGEVYYKNRARAPQDIPTTDAEQAFFTVNSFRDYGPPPIDRIVKNSEKEVARAQNQDNPNDNHGESFRETDEYRELLQNELKQEQAKVRLRRLRLMGYVDSLAGNKELSDKEHKILDPYIEYFQDETDAMKQQLAEGKTPEQVAVSYIGKYDSFFNPDTPIHTQIARLRALKKYTFAHNLKS